MRFLQSPKGLSPTGSAGSLVAPLLPLLACVIYAGFRWPELALFESPASVLYRTLGFVWLGLGILFWAATLLYFVPHWTQGELITSGPYALCRHPLYALLPYFVLPALGLITQNRGYFILALISLPLALRAGAREEEDLLRLYGETFVTYARRTSRLLPLPAAGHLTRPLAQLAWGAATILILYAGTHA